jgi:hypothetical protein
VFLTAHRSDLPARNGASVFVKEIAWIDRFGRPRSSSNCAMRSELAISGCPTAVATGKSKRPWFQHPQFQPVVALPSRSTPGIGCKIAKQLWQDDWRWLARQPHAGSCRVVQSKMADFALIGLRSPCPVVRKSSFSSSTVKCRCHASPISLSRPTTGSASRRPSPISGPAFLAATVLEISPSSWPTASISA